MRSKLSGMSVACRFWQGEAALNLRQACRQRCGTVSSSAYTQALPCALPRMKDSLLTSL